jgi:hypothetical protein
MSCYQPYRGEEEQRATYFAHRRALLAGCPLGSRPWAFWKFDPAAPRELREMLRGRMEEVAGEITRGMPRLAVYSPEDAVEEPEWAFLERHGLLSREEKALVPAWEEQLLEELACWDLEHDDEIEDDGELEDNDPETAAGPMPGPTLHPRLVKLTPMKDEVDNAD